MTAGMGFSANTCAYKCSAVVRPLDAAVSPMMLSLTSRVARVLAPDSRQPIGRVSPYSQLPFSKASELVRDGAHTLQP
jgi:hypothetical protein